MDESVEYWGEQDTHSRDEDESGEQGVCRGEDLPPSGMNRVDRPHAAENHGCIECGVQPGESFEEVVSQNSHAQGKTDDEYRKSHVSQNAQRECRSGYQGFFMMFKKGQS